MNWFTIVYQALLASQLTRRGNWRKAQRLMLK